ncbi:MAG TPA: hypothetical protein V6D10_25065 [Trichocoleus sp.]
MPAKLIQAAAITSILYLIMGMSKPQSALTSSTTQMQLPASSTQLSFNKLAEVIQHQ